MTKKMTKREVLGWNPENSILTKIKAGSDSGENIALRPLRELIQNADDARSDRIAIRISGDSMVFSNDGLTLTGNPDAPEAPGTLDALTE